MTPGVVVLAGSAAFAGYTYAGYPALLWLLSRRRRAARVSAITEWPLISIVLPVYNEEAEIRHALDAILAADYPASRRQVVVVSDASTDRTDDIVREYAGRGVELLRRPGRGGKTAAENAALPIIRGEVVVNTDASVRVHAGALKALVRALEAPGVGVASARDVSVAAGQGNSAEAGYVGYEMWVRALETAVRGIVGASGCLYAIRADIHRHPVPEELSRDFASALTARELGYRAVSVPDAICFVPHTPSLREEYRRKVRTIARGLNTLAYKRRLLNPWRYGAFAWMLLSHKVCRWVLPWAGVAALAALGTLAVQNVWAGVMGAGVSLGLVGALSGWCWPGDGAPRLLRALALGVASNVAVLHAWVRAAAGRKTPSWAPTRRPSPALTRSQHYGERPQHDLEILQR